MRAASACVAWKVGSSVAMPRMISTSFMTGTGFMKCMPMNFSGRSVPAPSRVIEIDEVFDAIMHDGFRCGRSALKIARFTSSFSVAASITRSHVAERVVVGAPC
ncbi:MAG: hypothetical protein QM753_11595 [Thermomicrobiales bacterium]